MNVEDKIPALYPLGIVGSSQIARMMYQAALKLGIPPRLFAESYDDSAAQAAADAVFHHPDSLASFAADCSVLTFEHERLDMGLLMAIEDKGNVLRPGPKTLRAAFDKLHQRLLLRNRGFHLPAFAEIRGPDDLLDFAQAYGFPLILKTIRAAPPNTQGVWKVDDRESAMRVLAAQGSTDLMAEEYQALMAEIVVVLARRPGGNVRFYPIAEVVNRGGVCSEIIAPARIGQNLAAEARQIAQKLANELDSVGVLAVEMFVTAEGLVVNELAARPHNAGHFTIEGTPTSQFENHVRAVLDLPLGPTWANTPAAVTVNVIGSNDGVDPSRHLADALGIEGAQIHLYGKIPRPGRKLGHITVLSDDVDDALEMARRANAALHGRRSF